jgi:rubrerythrin
MDRMSSIELALKNERTEMDFYLNEARRSNNPLAQTMFKSLAQDEEEHMTRIRALHEKLVSGGSWPEDLPIEVQDTNIRDVLDGLVEKQGSAADHDRDDEDALERAAEFEAKGAKFYSDLAGICDNPMEKDFFSFLSRIEKEHHLSVVDSLAYLRDPQAWMMEHERSGLDGA